MNIGKRLKKIRTEKGLSQREFGKLIGKPYTGVCKIENGKQGVSLTDVDQICTALDISILDLIHVPTETLVEELGKRKEFSTDLYGG